VALAVREDTQPIEQQQEEVGQEESFGGWFPQETLQLLVRAVYAAVGAEHLTTPHSSLLVVEGAEE
jgi:hypothetical protein